MQIEEILVWTWFDTLRSFLTNALGFQNCQADSSLFFKKTSSGCVFLLVYVDDILVTESDIASIIQTLNHQFSQKDIGELHYFLGLEVSRGATGMHVSQ